MALWSIAVLLLAGIAVGILWPGRFTHVFGDAALYVFLPALIFEGSWQLDSVQLRRMWMPISLLAFPGVILTAAIVAFGVHYILGTAWATALLLGAILSATDPVAVLAIFRRLPVPRALASIVESESLLNDAAAVVIYGAVLAAVIFSASGSVLVVSLQAALGVVLGIALGAGFGLFGALLFRASASALFLALLTVAGAYACYYLAGRFAWSGLFAVIAFAIVLRTIERHRAGERAAPAVDRFWILVATIANGILFFLIGAAFDLTSVGRSLGLAAVTLACLALARFALGSGLLSFSRPRLPRTWRTVIDMAGMRGALCLALALATPAAFSGRGVVIDVTFFVVVVSLLAGTFSFAAILSRIRLPDLELMPVPLPDGESRPE